jgi:hypothetical protein
VRVPEGRRPTTQALLVRIEQSADGWPISLFREDGENERWLSEPVAQDVIPGPLPPLDGGGGGPEEIRRFLLDQDQESPHFEEIGKALHALLHYGDVGAKWRELAGAGGARLLLDLPDTLSTLPWELMCEDSTWPATDISGPLVRVGPSFPGAAALSRVRWPLRVLVVIGSREDDRVVEAREELINLNHAFRRMCGQVDVEFLHQPTRTKVRETYRDLRPHIFHFIGHGDVDERRGRLLLGDRDTGEDKPWTAADIKMDLKGWQPRLAILNACRSKSVEDQDGAWGIGDAFLQLGVPAVIGMQADIRGDAAAVFTGELYRALANGEPLDVAVTRGRIAITDKTSIWRRDFALPSLTVSAPPDSVLQMRFGVGEKHLRKVEGRHRRFPAFVDRATERRRLWRELDPEPDEHERVVGLADAIAITGPSGVGKSELARWCVGACELHGGNAAYVNFAGAQRLGFVEALRLVAEALAESPVHGERNRGAFESWSGFAATLSAGDGPPPAADALGNAFVFFRDALRDAADEQPMLLALDGLEKLTDEHLELLCEYLLEPIAAAKLEPVRVIIALSDEQAVRLSESLRAAMGDPIVLTTFEPRQFRYIAGHYLRYHFKVEPRELEKSLSSLPIQTNFSWPAVAGLTMLAQTFGWEPYDHA